MLYIFVFKTFMRWCGETKQKGIHFSHQFSFNWFWTLIECDLINIWWLVCGVQAQNCSAHMPSLASLGDASFTVVYADGWWGRVVCLCLMWTHQQVFWFDVSVHNVEAVEVFDGIDQIVEHAAGVSLCVPGGTGDGVEKISPLWESQGGEQCNGGLSVC